MNIKIGQTVDQDFGKGTHYSTPFHGAQRSQEITVNGTVVGSLVTEWTEEGAYDGSVRIAEITGHVGHMFRCVHLFDRNGNRIATTSQAKAQIKQWIKELM